jgi:hypothetical protein
VKSKKLNQPYNILNEKTKYKFLAIVIAITITVGVWYVYENYKIAKKTTVLTPEEFRNELNN